MTVNRAAEMRPMRSPKFKRPTARPPRTTVKFNQERKVRSLAKKTFGSTRVGRAIRLPGFRYRVSLSCSVLFFFHSLRYFDLVVPCGTVQGLILYLPGAVWRRGWLDMTEEMIGRSEKASRDERERAAEEVGK